MDKKGKEIIKTLESKVKLLSNEKIVSFLEKNIRLEDETKVRVLDREIQNRMKPLEPRSKVKNGHDVCVECGQNIDIRVATLYSGMVEILVRIEEWCKVKERNEFKTDEVKHFFKGSSQNSRFGDWIYFGELLNPKGKGKWEMNLERTEQFLKGELAIYTKVEINPLNGNKKYSDKRKIGGVSNLREFLDEDNYYKAVYKPQDVNLEYQNNE